MNQSLPLALVDEEWDEIIAALTNTRFLVVAQKLQKNNNLPQLPAHIFEKGDCNQGEEAMNMVFRNKNVPFHLKRIGNQGGLRSERRLAIVRWQYAKQLRFDFDKNVRIYRNYHK